MKIPAVHGGLQVGTSTQVPPPILQDRNAKNFSLAESPDVAQGMKNISKGKVGHHRAITGMSVWNGKNMNTSQIRKAQTAVRMRQSQEKCWACCYGQALGKQTHVGSRCTLHSLTPLFEIVRQDRQDGEPLQPWQFQENCWMCCDA